MNKNLKILSTTNHRFIILKILAESAAAAFISLLLPKIKSVKNRILFLNTGFIGDLIVSSIICENDNLFKDSHSIEFVIKEQYKELFSDYSGRVHVTGFDYQRYKSNFKYKYKFLKKLRNHGFEKAFNLTAERGIINEEIILLCGASNKYALNSDSKYLPRLINKLINNMYAAFVIPSGGNEYEKHYRLLINFFNAKREEIKFYNEKTFTGNNFQNSNEHFHNGRYIVVAPFSKEGYKDWGIIHFRSVIKNLSASHKLVLIGSTEQREGLYQIKKGLSNVEAICGTFKLNELAALLAASKLFIGLDSGPAHMAVKLKVPSIVILGGGEFGRFFPHNKSDSARFLYERMTCFNCGWNCIYKNIKCVVNISPARVIKESDKLLNNRNLLSAAL